MSLKLFAKVTGGVLSQSLLVLGAGRCKHECCHFPTATPSLAATSALAVAFEAHKLCDLCSWVG